MAKNFGEQPREEIENSPLLQRLEVAREHSTEVQKNVQELQCAKYGTALLRIMDRTGDNTEIVNNLNAFLDALDHQSNFGDSGERIGPGRQKDLAKFLGVAAMALRGTVGHGERGTEKIDLSEWNNG